MQIQKERKKKNLFRKGFLIFLSDFVLKGTILDTRLNSVVYCVQYKYPILFSFHSPSLPSKAWLMMLPLRGWMDTLLLLCSSLRQEVIFFWLPITTSCHLGWPRKARRRQQPLTDHDEVMPSRCGAAGPQGSGSVGRQYYRVLIPGSSYERFCDWCWFFYFSKLFCNVLWSCLGLRVIRLIFHYCEFFSLKVETVKHEKEREKKNNSYFFFFFFMNPCCLFCSVHPISITLITVETVWIHQRESL